MRFERKNTRHYTDSIRGNSSRQTKRCSRCGKVLPIDDFAHNQTRPDGRSTHCKACISALRRERLERLRKTLGEIESCVGCGMLKSVSILNKQGLCPHCADIEKAMVEVMDYTNRQKTRTCRKLKVQGKRYCPVCRKHLSSDQFYESSRAGYCKRHYNAYARIRRLAGQLSY
jgi:uncharacterized CHY-type Zn-finger protein